VRFLLNAATALSALLALATAGLWVRSYWRLHDVGYIAERWSVASANCRDGWAFYWDAMKRAGMSRQDYGVRHLSHSPDFIAPNFGALAPAWPIAIWRNQTYAVPSIFILVPYWLAAVFATAPLAWAIRHPKRRARYRARTGLCPACGYDLRATPGRCPECGAIPAR
jgi:hypothetical protein